MVTIEDLISKVSEYNPEADFDVIKTAYEIADKAHSGQIRNSGEPYIIHPLNVAYILAELNMDTPTLCAGLLHDVIEDTSYTYEDLEGLFGEEIANLVRGVTKLKNLHFRDKKETQAENIRRMVLAMARDIRVIIIKLADRLHNMRTLEYKKQDKQRAIARETIEIYSPLAHRLGIYKIKSELDDLSLRYLDSDSYYDLVEKVNKKKEQREKEISDLVETLRSKLLEMGIKSEIYGRPKSFYSIYRKMRSQQKNIEEIFDLMALRVIVDTLKQCYEVLGAVHSLWKPIPGRFKDYIAMPKANMYQSIHTTLICDNGQVFEVQIRTVEMHKMAEFGVAAHWVYKEGQARTSNFDRKIQWIRQLLEWQADIADPSDFVNAMKVDFSSAEVFVFTPNGDVVELPENSTPIDFAYRIHSQVGNHCVGAKVNGRIVTLNHHLKTGDIVEVITSKTGQPSRDWLNIAQSSQAKSKIRQWFKQIDKDQNIHKGQESLEREIRKIGLPKDFIDEDFLRSYAESISLKDLNGLYASIGYGSTTIQQVISKLQSNYERKNQDKEKPIILKTPQAKHMKNDTGIVVVGADNLKIRFARCCNPVPGDPVVGFVSKGRGIAVHRTDCKNIINTGEPERIIDVYWNNVENVSYETEIQLKVTNRKGILADITTMISNNGIDLTDMNTKKHRRSDEFLVNLTLEISDRDKLSEMIRKLSLVDGVIDVYRIHK